MAYTNRVSRETVSVPVIKSNSVTTNSFDSRTHNVTTTRSGEKVIDWKEKIKRGDSAASPYTLEGSKILLQPPLDYTAKYVHKMSSSTVLTASIYGYPYHKILEPVPAHLPTNNSEAEAIALSKTYKKVQSEWQHMNSPAIIAEFLDVIRQFGKPAEALVDLTNRRLNRLALEQRGLKGSTSFRKIRYAEIVASTWLEYSFGLAPLISDTEKAAETLARWQLENELPQLRKRMRSRGISRAVTSETGIYSSSPVNFAPNSHSSTVKTTTERRVQYTLGLQGEISAAYGSNERLKQLLGFDHANWIPAAWEAVPWSWLLDYFTNIQQILDASVTNTSRIKWISKAVSTVTEVDYTTRLSTNGIDKGFSLDYNRAGPWRKSPPGSGDAKVVRTTLSRTVPTSLGVPPLVFEHPFENAKKVANMVAVLFKRKGNSALWIT